MAEKLNSKRDALLLGRRIRNARKSHGLTLKSLGYALNIHHSQISRIERGEAVTFSKNLQNICTYLKIASPTGSRLSLARLSQQIEEMTTEVPTLEPVVERLLLAMEELLEMTKSSYSS